MVTSEPRNTQDSHNKEHEDSANAKRVLNVDESGIPFDDTNPLPVSSVTHIATDLEGKGKVSVGTTAVEITFIGTTEVIIIQADSANTGVIYVGKSDVDSSGNNSIVELQPGWSIKLDYDDSDNAVYVVSDAVSQNVFAGSLQ
jgi:hypothetical protein